MEKESSPAAHEPHGEGSEFTPIRPNPYIVGNPVRDRTMFFGREVEFELVRRRFSESTHGGLLIFCGERRSGKTSILFQILDHRLGPDFIPVLIDMQSMAITSELDFLGKVSAEVRDALGPEMGGISLPEFTAGSSPAATFQRFIQEVLRAHPHRKLILLFDEYELFENKIESGVLGSDVLQILASLMEQQSVFLIFTGSQHLEQRKKQYWQILPKSLWKTISYLDREDALKLIRNPVEGRVRYGPGAVEAICRLTAGQPFYTQAICQNLVDQLNENRTNDAPREAVFKVVDSIVNNPLPQMIFLWDGLARDEKLVLALLAEALDDDQVFATQIQISQMIKHGKYPLALGRARIAQALEKLFKEELLLKDDAKAAGYSFRMDLWRLWIRRMHSVWQVMREEKLEIRPPSRWRRYLPIAVPVALLAVVLVVYWRPFTQNDPSPRLKAVEPKAQVVLRAIPAATSIFVDDRLVAAAAEQGVAVYRDSLSAARLADTSSVDASVGRAMPGLHVVAMHCPEYADTTFQIQLVAGRSHEETISLRPRLGDVLVETIPPGAIITVDGREYGPSPRRVVGLRVPEKHRVEAVLADYSPATQEGFKVLPDTSITLTLSLAMRTTTVLVTTAPLGAEIWVDGNNRGESPLTLLDLPFGDHRIVARLTGYVEAQRSLAVTASTSAVNLELQAEPPGELLVSGDGRIVEIRVDDEVVARNVPAIRREFPVGQHEVVVYEKGKEIQRHRIEILSRQMVQFNFIDGTVKVASQP